MTVTEALELARLQGVEVTLDGDDLVLRAEAAPPPRLLAILGRGKWDIVAALRLRVAEERRSIVQWVNDHFASSPLGVCGHCGDGLATRGPFRSAFRRKRSRRGACLVSPCMAGGARSRGPQSTEVRPMTRTSPIFNWQKMRSEMNRNVEQTTSNQLLADGWRLTRAILALKGLQILHTIEFRIDSATHIRATRTATLDELAKAVTALDEAIERRSQNRPNVTDLHSHLKIEDLNKQRDALVELQKRAGRSESPASTTVIEALFPDIPAKKRTSQEKAEIERWLALRKEEGHGIDPETAEVDWHYAQTLDPYGVYDEWDLPEEFDQVGREYFARAPESGIWVWFGDLPKQTVKRLEQRGKSAFVDEWPFGDD